MRLDYPLTSNQMTHVFFARKGIESEMKRCSGISIAQYRILAFLLRAGEPHTQSQIAESVGFTSKTVSRALQSLTGKGSYVGFKSAKEDQRSRYVYLTRVGLDKLREAEKAVENFVVSLWQPLKQEYTRILLFGVQKGDIVQGSNEVQSKPARAIAFYITDIDMVTSRISGIVKDFDLTMTEFRMLFELFCYPCGLRTGQVSSALLLYPYEITEAKESLLEWGYVEEIEDPFDGRAVALRITQEGIERMKPVAMAVDDFYCRGMYATEQRERETYLTVSDYIVMRLRHLYRDLLADGASNVGVAQILEELRKQTEFFSDAENQTFSPEDYALSVAGGGHSLTDMDEDNAQQPPA